MQQIQASQVWQQTLDLAAGRQPLAFAGHWQGSAYLRPGADAAELESASHHWQQRLATVPNLDNLFHASDSDAPYFACVFSLKGIDWNSSNAAAFSQVLAQTGGPEPWLQVVPEHLPVFGEQEPWPYALYDEDAATYTTLNQLFRATGPCWWAGWTESTLPCYPVFYLCQATEACLYGLWTFRTEG